MRDQNKNKFDAKIQVSYQKLILWRLFIMIQKIRELKCGYTDKRSRIHNFFDF